MNHHLRILDFALAGLWRRRAKTLTVVAVYALVVALVASLLLYVEALRREARLLLAGAPEIVVQRLRGGRHELIPGERAAAIAAVRGVRAVTPRVWGYSYDPPTDSTFTFWGADSVPEGTLEISDDVYRGAPRTCVIGQGVADLRFLGPGDRLPVKASDGSLYAPRVVGVFTAGSALLTHDLVVLPTADLRRLFGIAPELATDLAVEVTNPLETDTVARKIQAAWPDVRVVTRRQVLATWDAVFDWRGGVWAAALLGAVAAFAVLVWDQATGLTAEEAHTLGVLKAVGWSPRNVLELKLWEGAAVSLTAVATGLLLAEVHLLWTDGALFAPVMRGWSELFPRFEVVPRFDGPLLLVCLLLAVVPYVAASLVPAWRAAVTDPDTVLRS